MLRNGWSTQWCGCVSSDLELDYIPFKYQNRTWRLSDRLLYNVVAKKVELYIKLKILQNTGYVTQTGT